VFNTLSGNINNDQEEHPDDIEYANLNPNSCGLDHFFNQSWRQIIINHCLPFVFQLFQTPCNELGHANNHNLPMANDSFMITTWER
jgi:hypothetical protein